MVAPGVGTMTGADGKSTITVRRPSGERLSFQTVRLEINVKTELESHIIAVQERGWTQRSPFAGVFSGRRLRRHDAQLMPLLSASGLPLSGKRNVVDLAYPPRRVDVRRRLSAGQMPRPRDWPHRLAKAICRPADLKARAIDDHVACPPQRIRVA